MDTLNKITQVTIKRAAMTHESSFKLKWVVFSKAE